MRVFVTGGTGALGRFVLPALTQAGHDVTAIARTPEKSAQVTAAGATPSDASLFDATALAAAITGHDAIINLATSIPTSPATYLSRKAWAANDRIRIEGSAALVGAAMTAGVARIVQESIVFLYPTSKGLTDEDTPVAVVPLLRSAIQAEENAHKLTDGVVLRFGLFYGPGSAHTAQMLSFARHRMGTLLGPPRRHVSSIHLADAASAVEAALHAPAGLYNVVDDEPLTKRQYMRAISAAVGKRPLFWGPGWAATLAGSHTAALTRSNRISNARFRDATGWKPTYPSAREGWVSVAEAAG